MENSITTPHSSITIRTAIESDVQAYRTLRLEALHNHPEAFGADYAVNAARPDTFWTERLRSLGSEGTLYFAAHGDELIGMTGIQRNDSPKTHHSAFIWGVYVKAEWRGLRIADALIKNCIAWAAAQGIKIVKLAVITTNPGAIACYTRCGFKAYGIEPQALFIDGRLYDDLLMARSLSD